MNKYILATDGACRTNHIPANENSVSAWGFVLHTINGEDVDEFTNNGVITGISATNNSAELTAAIEGLKATPVGATVTMYVDSSYVRDNLINWIAGWKRNGWKGSNKKPVKNKELWVELDALSSERDVNIYRVKGHSGHELNEQADQQANEALDQHYSQKPA